MKKNQHLTTPSRRAGFDRKLIGYSATALTTLILAPIAEAQIKNITTFSTDGGTTFLPTAPSLLAHDPRVNFSAGTALHAVGFAGFFKANATFGYPNLIGGKILAATGTYTARHFSLSAPIVGNLGGNPFRNVGFSAPATGYVGFKTVRNAQTYYGWLRVKLAGSGGIPTELTFVDHLGDGIYGAFGLATDHVQAGIGATAIPEPASVATGLALFALGAAGVREHRRRRKLAA